MGPGPGLGLGPVSGSRLVPGLGPVLGTLLGLVPGLGLTPGLGPGLGLGRGAGTGSGAGSGVEAESEAWSGSGAGSEAGSGTRSTAGSGPTAIADDVSSHCFVATTSTPTQRPFIRRRRIRSGQPRRPLSLGSRAERLRCRSSSRPVRCRSIGSSRAGGGVPAVPRGPHSARERITGRRRCSAAEERGTGRRRCSAAGERGTGRQAANLRNMVRVPMKARKQADIVFNQNHNHSVLH